MTSSSATARALRLDAVPLVLPLLVRLNAFRRLAFRTVSQTAINYRDSQLSGGRAGTVHGGDRLPWVQVESPRRDADNFAPLTSLEWQVHVYGEAIPATRALCAGHRLALHEFTWQRSMERAGLVRDALYLVRPDGYVALAAPDQSAETLGAYLTAHGIRVRPPA